MLRGLEDDIANSLQVGVNLQKKDENQRTISEISVVFGARHPRDWSFSQSTFIFDK